MKRRTAKWVAWMVLCAMMISMVQMGTVETSKDVSQVQFKWTQTLQPSNPQGENNATLAGEVKISISGTTYSDTEKEKYIKDDVYMTLSYEGTETDKSVTIYYTLNGDDPTQGGATFYSGEEPMKISPSQTGTEETVIIKAVAMMSVDNSDSVAYSDVAERSVTFAIPEDISTVDLTIPSPAPGEVFPAAAECSTGGVDPDSLSITWLKGESVVTGNAEYNTTYIAELVLEAVDEWHAFSNTTQVSVNDIEVYNIELLNNGDLKLYFSVTTRRAKLIKVCAPDNVEVDNGTPIGAWNLPRQVQVWTEDSNITALEVRWNLDNVSYDVNSPNRQEVTVEGGVINFPDYCLDKNEVDLDVSIKVIIKARGAQPGPGVTPTPTPSVTEPPVQTAAPTQTTEPAPTTQPEVPVVTPAPQEPVTTSAPEKYTLSVAQKSITVNAFCKVKTNTKKGIYVPKVKTTKNIKTSYDKEKLVVKYSSSNPRVATVSKAGKVKGLKMGTAKITVTLYKKTNAAEVLATKTVNVTVKPTLYIKHLTGKKYIMSGGKKFKNKKGVQFKVVGASKPFYLFYRSGNKKYSIYMNKKWNQNVTSIPKGSKTWVPLTGKKYNFFISSNKKGKTSDKTSSNVLAWKI